MKNSFLDFTITRPYLSSIVIVLPLFALLVSVGILAGNIFSENLKQYDFIGVYSMFIAGQLALLFVVLCLVRASHTLTLKDFSWNGFGKGMLLGWFVLLISITMLISSIASVPAEYFIVPRFLPLLIAFIHPFTTAFLEEIWMRGLVLNILLRKLGDTRKGVITAVFVSSAIFGFGHIFNILDPRTEPNLLYMLGFCLFAMMIGVFYAALYLRTKTLWAPIILHALFNLPNYIGEAVVSPEGLRYLSEQSANDIGGLSNLLVLAIAAPCMIIGLIYLRKYQWERPNGHDSYDLVK